MLLLKVAILILYRSCMYVPLFRLLALLHLLFKQDAFTIRPNGLRTAVLACCQGHSPG